MYHFAQGVIANSLSERFLGAGALPSCLTSRILLWSVNIQGNAVWKDHQSSITKEGSSPPPAAPGAPQHVPTSSDSLTCKAVPKPGFVPRSVSQIHPAEASPHPENSPGIANANADF